MPVDATHNAAVGFAIFDAWLKAVERRQHQGGRAIGSAVVDAAFKAFDHYVDTVEMQHSAEIAGVSAQLTGLGVSGTAGACGYALTPQGNGAVPVTMQEIAPFLALNLMG